jgi:hypothetical protein
VTGDDSGVLAKHDRNSVSRQNAAIERAEVGQLAGRPTDESTTEIVLAPGIEFYVVREHAAVLVEKSGQAAVAWILEPSATELYVNRICTSLPSSLRIA